MQLTLIGNIGPVADTAWNLPIGYEITALKDSDWPALAELYLTAYPREIVADFAAAKEEMSVTQAGEYGPLLAELSPVIKRENEIAGVVMTVEQAPWPDTPAGLFIIEVITHPRHQRKGLAKAGLLWLAKKAHAQGFRTLALRVESENIGAVTLYRKLGFSEWGA